MNSAKDMIRKIIICAILLVTVLQIPMHLQAQNQSESIPLTESNDSDLQTRFKVALEIPLAEKLKLTWGEQLRTKK